MVILALDLGTKCGYAFSNNNGSGVEDLKPNTHESSGMRYRKFAMFLDSFTPNFVVYEEVHAHVGIEAAHVYGGLVAILQAHCIVHEIEYRGVAVQTIKKHATGKGNAKKDDMIVAATLKFPKINIIDDNHADALHLLDYAQKVLFKES